MADYEVEAELVIRDRKARAAIARIHRSLGGLIKQIDLVNSKAARMGTILARAHKKTAAIGGRARGDVAAMAPLQKSQKKAASLAAKGGVPGVGTGSYIAAGAALGGILLTTRAITQQVAAASAFRKEMEMGQLALATMFNLIDKMPLDKAIARASNQMLKFNVMAAEAPGSGQDMMNIFTRLYGPMKRLGETSREIEAAVKGTAVMGKAFGIQDVGALGRDVEEMLTGRAGKRTTKIFALANSWGLLNMEAKEFNALAPEKRMEIVNRLIDNFSPLGVTMAKTWEGASEAFAGWLNIIRDMGAKGLFDKLGEQLYRINQQIERNVDTIKAYMGLVGASLGKTAGGVISLAMSAAKGTAVTPIVAGEAALAGGLVAGVAALAVFGTMMAKFLLPMGVLAKIAGVIAAIGFGKVILIIGAALIGLVAVFQVITKNADTLGKFLTVSLGGVFGMVLHLLSSTFWSLVAIMRTVVSVVAKVLSPVIANLSMMFMAVAGVGLVVVETFRMIWETLSRIFGSFAGFNDSALGMELFVHSIKEMAATAVSAISQFFGKLLMLLGQALKFVGMRERAGQAFKASTIMFQEGMAATKRIRGITASPFGEDGDGGGRTGGKQFQAPAEINVQRMIINQEFKGKADPDRVVASFMRAVTDQAESAISSMADIPVRA